MLTNAAMCHGQWVRRLRQGLIAHGAVLVLCMAPLAADDAPDQTAASHFQAGLAYERLGRLDPAYTELQLGCTLAPNDASMALALGILANRLGRYEVAQRSL